MIQMIRSLTIFAGIFVLLGVVSCREEENETPFEAVGDVYYVSKLEENQKVTARAFYAYGNKAIVEAIAISPSEETFLLDKSKENSYTVFKEPNEADFAPNYPDEGIYTFNLESNENDKMELTDKLVKVDLKIPEFTGITYEALDESYDLDWKSIDNVQDYLVELYDSNDNLVFISELFGAGLSSFTFIPNDNGTWEKDIVPGETYSVFLYAYTYDEDVITSGLVEQNSTAFNIGEISIGLFSFTWDKQ